MCHSAVSSKVHSNVLQCFNELVFVLQFPDLNALIMRRFKGPNDVEEARQAVHKVWFVIIQSLVFSSFYLGVQWRVVG